MIKFNSKTLVAGEAEEGLLKDHLQRLLESNNHPIQKRKNELGNN